MLLELAKPVALLLCLLSLYALFHTAFLSTGNAELLLPNHALNDKILDSLLFLAISAGICLVSGQLFREGTPEPHSSLSATLPLQLLYWATGIMLILFILSWYLETYCVFYRSTRW